MRIILQLLIQKNFGKLTIRASVLKVYKFLSYIVKFFYKNPLVPLV